VHLWSLPPRSMLMDAVGAGAGAGAFRHPGDRLKTIFELYFLMFELYFLSFELYFLRFQTVFSYCRAAC